MLHTNISILWLSATTMSVRMLLRPTSAGLNMQRNMGGNATTSVPPGSIGTRADFPEITFPTMLFRIIFKGYYNRMHELQVLNASQPGLFTCLDIYLISLMDILLLDTVAYIPLWIDYGLRSDTQNCWKTAEGKKGFYNSEMNCCTVYYLFKPLFI